MKIFQSIVKGDQISSEFQRSVTEFRFAKMEKYAVRCKSSRDPEPRKDVQFFTTKSGSKVESGLAVCELHFGRSLQPRIGLLVQRPAWQTSGEIFLEAE